MSEIEKMYENAGIEVPIVRLKIFKDDNGKIYTQPPFTAEKQIELIKWAARREPKVEIGYSSVCGYWVENPTDTRYYFGDQFDNTLASLINNLWQDLTEEERKQIKEILE